MQKRIIAGIATGLLLLTLAPMATASAAGSGHHRIDRHSKPLRTTTTTSTAPKTTTTTVPAIPSGAFPTAATTGWRHTGVTLKSVPGQVTSGPGWHYENNTFYVDSANAVIDGLDIQACVKILADNVTIQRSRITCDSYYAVNTSDPPKQFSALNLTDVEIEASLTSNTTSNQTIAVMGTNNAHYTRLDVHGIGSSGPRIASGNTVEDSYFHDFSCTPPDHSAGMSANDGGSNIVIRHNNIDIQTATTGCATAAWEIAKDFGTYDNVLTENNLFNGGAYCAYAGINVPGDSHGQATNIEFINNTFGRKYASECGSFGAIAQWGSAGGSVWSGNVWGDGAKATSTHKTGDPVNP